MQEKLDKIVKKVPITTNIHPEFKKWLDDNGLTLSAWIESQYETQHEQGQIDQLRSRIKDWMARAYKQQDEINALKFRVDYLESKIADSGIKLPPSPGPSPPNVESKTKTDKPGGLLKGGHNG